MHHAPLRAGALIAGGIALTLGAVLVPSAACNASSSPSKGVAPGAVAEGVELPAADGKAFKSPASDSSVDDGWSTRGKAVGKPWLHKAYVQVRLFFVALINPRLLIFKGRFPLASAVFAYICLTVGAWIAEGCAVAVLPKLGAPRLLLIRMVMPCHLLWQRRSCRFAFGAKLRAQPPSHSCVFSGSAADFRAAYGKLQEYLQDTAASGGRSHIPGSCCPQCCAALRGQKQAMGQAGKDYPW